MAQSRRSFLTQSLFYGCSAAASPLITPVTLAAVPGEARLVVIVLRGAMDGLDVVRPVGDVHYGALRPDLAQTDQFDLTGIYAANAGLASLKPLWDAKELAFAHAVSTPYRDKRSHFEGQDVLEAGYRTWGEAAAQGGSGWVNRLLTLIPNAHVRTAFAVGREDLLLLNGPEPTSSWAPNGRIDLSAQGRRFLELIYEQDPLFHENAEIALDLSEDSFLAGEAMQDDSMMQATLAGAQKASRTKALAQFAADRLNEDTRIAAFSVGGWDTHNAQHRRLPATLEDLSQAILTLRDRLGSNWQQTTVLCMTEFGRTVRQNGNLGTDHGTGGAMIMAGGGVRGGKVYGHWPGLGASDLYENRDLMPTRDVRDFAGWALHDLFGIATNDVERTVFPNLDLTANPRFIL